MNTAHLIVSDLELDTALADQSVPFAVRVAWRLLRESDVRPDEAVALDVPDVQVAERFVILRETKEGGAFEAEVTATVAVQLEELIGGRRSGPVLNVDGRRLTTQELAETFRKVTGKSVHALRFTRQIRRHRSAERPQLVSRVVAGAETAEPA